MKSLFTKLLGLSCISFIAYGFGEGQAPTNGQANNIQQMSNAQHQAGSQMSAQAMSGFVTGGTCFGQKWIENDDKAEAWAQGNMETQNQGAANERCRDGSDPKSMGTVAGVNGQVTQSWGCPDGKGGWTKPIAYNGSIADAGKNKQEELKELEAQYKSDNTFKSIFNYAECVGHIVKGAMDLKAANALKEAAKQNQGLVNQLQLDPNELQSLFRDPDLLAGQPPVDYTPDASEFSPADAGTITGAPTAGTEGEGFNPELDPDAPGGSLNVDSLRDKLRDGSGEANARGSVGEVAAGNVSGYNDQSEHPVDDANSKIPIPAADIGKYRISQGGAGSGIRTLGVGKKETASPEQIQKAFDSLIKGILGDSNKMAKKEDGIFMTSSRDPASNKNATGDESINITSKSIFEIITERIQITKRQGRINHPEW